jgi:predicted XRE-type DNA-binding protein
MNEEFADVWDAIEDDPARRENLKVRSALMSALCDFIDAEGLTQKEAARRMRVTQPRISDLKRGKIDLFSIDGLVAMLGAAGLHVEVQIGKAA